MLNCFNVIYTDGSRLSTVYDIFVYSFQSKIHNIVFLIYVHTIRTHYNTYMNSPPGYTRHIRILYSVYLFQINASKINLAVYFLFLFRIFHFEVIIHLVCIGYAFIRDKYISTFGVQYY